MTVKKLIEALELVSPELEVEMFDKDGKSMPLETVALVTTTDSRFIRVGVQ